MSKLLGFGLILTGLVIGGVGVPLSASAPGDHVIAASSFTALTAPVSVEGARTAEAVTAGSPIFKPLSPPTAAMTPPGAGAAERKSEALTVRAPHPALRPPAAPQARKPIVPAFETETIPADPTLITRAVQIELARVGCFAGAATGVWGPDTRRAMKAFTNRVNATLPVDKPDVVLLSLLKGQTSPVCGKACPTGQEGAADGRCVPRAVLAQAARKAHPAASRTAHARVPATSETIAAVPQPVQATPAPASAPGAQASLFVPFYSDTQRMALAGPVPAPGANPVALADVNAVPAAPLAAAASAAPDKHADKSKHARKRERREAPAAKVSYGQTRWAREFFRNATNTF